MAFLINTELSFLVIFSYEALCILYFEASKQRRCRALASVAIAMATMAAAWKRREGGRAEAATSHTGNEFTCT